VSNTLAYYGAEHFAAVKCFIVNKPLILIVERLEMFCDKRSSLLQQGAKMFYDDVTRSRFAMTEIKICLAKLLNRFKLEMDPETRLNLKKGSLAFLNYDEFKLRFLERDQ
jgi:hypothetical protein